MKRINHNSSAALMIISIVFTLLLVFSFGCAKKEEGDIKVGVILPLTGDVAEPGNKALNGIKLAVKEFNGSNQRRQIKLIVEDSKANPIDGVNALTKLISIDHVKLIVGDLVSGVTLAIAPIAEKNHVVILAPGSSNPKVRDAGDYIFRNWSSDNFDGEVMAKYLFNTLGKKSATVIFVNNEYGEGLADTFEKTFTEVGGRIVLKEKYEQGSTDFRTVIAKLKGSKSDSIFLPGQPKENGVLIRQMKENRITPKNTTITANLSVESSDFYASAGENGEGIIFSTPAFDTNSNATNIRKFVTAYEHEFKSKPDVVAGHGYDAAMIMLEALRRANYDIARVKDELYKIKGFPGVTGDTTFDERGDVIKPVMIKRLNKDGTGTIFETYKP